MAKAERARHLNEQPSGSQETAMSPREKPTDSKETSGEQKPVLPMLDTDSGSLMTRQPRVCTSRGPSGSPSDYSDVTRPLSPPEFPQRAGSSSPVQATASPAESTKSKRSNRSSKKQLKSPTSQKSPSISLRDRNPFSDTQASGDTPEVPQGLDPLLDCMLRMRNVNAEQVATIVMSDGPMSRKGESVTDDKANNWIHRQIVTDSSTDATGVLPAMTGAKNRTTKVFPMPKRSSSSGRNRPSEEGHRKMPSTSPADYLQVNIPHITFETGGIWPEMHAEVEQMPSY
ncbi:hypothetical protein PILCRDRAFT_9281 [Piloderma croceum F 1598]|uniref:Uncharacterized protein n=1 Tax=Piloderma croceum (strain F 1598) TaxID=765440 RepID=A0A0C3FM54_PILCF|nr:hypothetical protein PILCRDRAFT_9281 [Piloderma croceum F 1598]